VKSTPDNQELCRNLSPVVANVARSRIPGEDGIAETAPDVRVPVMYWICIICGCLTGGEAEAGCGGGGSREMQILGGGEMQWRRGWGKGICLREGGDKIITTNLRRRGRSGHHRRPRRRKIRQQRRRAGGTKP
jgi:hypothetical protein